MSKGIIKNYTFNTVTKAITLTDISTVRLDKLALVTDVTTNKILYNFADPSVSTATVSTNVITLSVLQGGESNSDKLRIDYDVESSDTNAFTDTTLPVSLASVPSHAVTNAGTFATQSTLQTGSNQIGHLEANQSVNQAQIAGTTTDTNSGNKSAGTQRVVLATDQPQLTNALKVDGSGATQPVTVASLPLPSGAATAVKQPALGTAGTPSADVISIQGVTNGTVVPVNVAAPGTLKRSVSYAITCTATNPQRNGISLTYLDTAPYELEITNVDGSAAIYYILDSVSLTSTGTSGNALTLTAHGLVVNKVYAIIFTASTLSASVTINTQIYYAKPSDANTIPVYNTYDGTNVSSQVNFTSGTGTFFTAATPKIFYGVLPATPSSVTIPWNATTAAISYQTSATPTLAATIRGY